MHCFLSFFFFMRHAILYLFIFYLWNMEWFPYDSLRILRFLYNFLKYCKSYLTKRVWALQSCGMSLYISFKLCINEPHLIEYDIVNHNTTNSNIIFYFTSSPHKTLDLILLLALFDGHGHATSTSSWPTCLCSRGLHSRRH